MGKGRQGRQGQTGAGRAGSGLAVAVACCQAGGAARVAMPSKAPGQPMGRAAAVSSSPPWPAPAAN